MYQLIISETGRNSLKEEANLFNTIDESFTDLEELKNYITDRYGKLPKGRNKIFIDDKEGKAQEIGFLYSFWNSDISHNSKAWFQTDWIEVRETASKPILIV